jgi:hypothetical protein
VRYSVFEGIEKPGKAVVVELRQPGRNGPGLVAGRDPYTCRDQYPVSEGASRFYPLAFDSSADLRGSGGKPAAVMTFGTSRAPVELC